MLINRSWELTYCTKTERSNVIMYCIGWVQWEKLLPSKASVTRSWWYSVHNYVSFSLKWNSMFVLQIILHTLNVSNYALSFDIFLYLAIPASLWLFKPSATVYNIESCRFFFFKLNSFIALLLFSDGRNVWKWYVVRPFYLRVL